MESRWHKRGMNPAELRALHPGVPSWMYQYLLAWVQVVTYSSPPGSWGEEKRPDASYILRYESAVRRPSSLKSDFESGGVRSLFRFMGEDEFLDFVDFLLYTLSQEESQRARPLIAKLEEILANGGSEWRVGTRDGFVSLEQRVPQGVVLAAEETVAGSGDAGQLLAEAWHAAFGKSPDAEEAYEKAIKAVEEAGSQVVSPNNRRTTLGTMIRDMKAQKSWRLDLPTPDADVPVKMADALWIGQESRHGGNGYRKPTQAEAEAAVLLAVPLVQWFTSGALALHP